MPCLILRTNFVVKETFRNLKNSAANIGVSMSVAKVSSESVAKLLHYCILFWKTSQNFRISA